MPIDKKTRDTDEIITPIQVETGHYEEVFPGDFSENHDDFFNEDDLEEK